MKRHSILAKLLLALAVCGMLLAPFAGQTMAAPAPSQQMTDCGHPVDKAADKPCCPDEGPMQDCGKTCTLMAMCATQLMDVTYFATLCAPMAIVVRTAPTSDAPLPGLYDIPKPRPPKSSA